MGILLPHEKNKGHIQFINLPEIMHLLVILMNFSWKGGMFVSREGTVSGSGSM